MRRSHGLQKPFNPMQMGTWVLLPILLIQFLFFATPILPVAAAIPCTICVFICGALTAHFTYRCCTIDPVDERLRCHLACQNEDTEGGNEIANRVPEDGEVKFCWVCSIDVHVSSMHCKFCNKCVEKFDHHCHWLNTCVGRANYESFFRLLGSVLAMEIIRGGTLAGLVTAFFIQYAGELNGSGSEGTTLERSNSWFGIDSGLTVAIVNSMFLAVDVACIVLLTQLFTLHIRLRREGITTYEYVVRTQQREREKERTKIELQLRRRSAIERAEQERKMVKKWRLTIAGCPHVGEVACRQCDPLRQEDENKDQQIQSLSSGKNNGESANHTADGKGNGSVMGGESMGKDAEKNAESISDEGNGNLMDGESMGKDVEKSAESIQTIQELETDSVSCIRETNDINAVESDEQNTQEIDASPLHAAMESRKIQQKQEEEYDEHGNSSQSNGKQKIKFVST